MKKRVRQDWEANQNSKLTYVWGYDCTEKHRVKRIKETNPNAYLIFEGSKPEDMQESLSFVKEVLNEGD